MNRELDSTARIAGLPARRRRPHLNAERRARFLGPGGFALVEVLVILAIVTIIALTIVEGVVTFGAHS